MVSEEDQMAAMVRHLIRQADKALEKEAESYDDILAAQLKELRQAVKEDRLPDAVKLSYSIKGAAGSMGWKLISQAAGFLRHVLEEDDKIHLLDDTIKVHLNTMDHIFANGLKGENAEGIVLIKELYALLEKYQIEPGT